MNYNRQHEDFRGDKIYFAMEGKSLKLKNILLSRIVIAGSIILLQIVWFITFFLRLTEYSIIINFFFTTLSIIALLFVINKRYNPAFKLAWSILILLFPLFGGLLYAMLGTKEPLRKMSTSIENTKNAILPFVSQKEEILLAIKENDKHAYGQVKYILDHSNSPIYKNTETKYYRSGEENFPDILEALKSAKHFIFLEYFIIANGRMWNEVLEVLKEKAAQGVDVRVMYDDVGSLTTLPYKYYKYIESFGIKCEAFNHFVPFFSVVMNNRDHRKILVIDGHTGFTGGINLADEYINEKNRFGYWKDTGIMLKGEAVWNLTVMFLTMWNAVRKTDTSYEAFMPKAHNKLEFNDDGYVQPYGDSPLDGETVGENVYLNIINNAVDYVYIFTPYLIIDNEMMVALCLAAKRGVDVRIVTPNIPDKKIVFLLTQSFYPQLIENGVKIYQFTPGFLHAKCFVSDDKVATVGTINMDYRSLYLHFECGVFLYNTKTVLEVRDDILNTIEQSRRISEEDLNSSFIKRFAQAVLILFAPLL